MGNEKYTDEISKIVDCKRKIIEIEDTAIDTIQKETVKTRKKFKTKAMG